MKNNVSITFTSEWEGIDSRIVRVEMSMKRGIPRFGIVGLALGSTREATERVRIALENSNFDFPLQNIIVNLSPADSKKDTSFFDLAIAVGILNLTGQLDLKKDLNNFLFLGEIGLDGTIKPIKGLSNILLSPLIKKFNSIVIPYQNKAESFISNNLDIFPISHIKEINEILNGNTIPKLKSEEIFPNPKINFGNIEIFQDQLIGFRSLILALTGKHHILFIGSPGGGKTMLANLAKEFLPPLNREEFEEIIKIKSLSEHINEDTIRNLSRPFRSPHHTSSDISIIGGGRKSRIGEVTLSHNGVLFLDELGEFKPSVIQALREPLEEGLVTISRVEYHITYPASFLLIAASNPCPCGFNGSGLNTCHCSPQKIQRYHSRLSGPFLDRMDLVVRVEPFGNSIRNKIQVNKSEIYDKILIARDIQEKRFKDSKIKFNGAIGGKNIEKICNLNSGSLNLINELYKNNFYSLRRIYKTIKIGRTIADLENSFEVKDSHLLEAIHYLQGKNDSIQKAA